MPFFQSPKPKEFRVKELNSSLSAEGMCWGSLQCFWGTVKESADSCHANCTLYHDGSVRLSSQLPLQYIYTITQTDKTHESEKTTWGMFLYQISVWHEINPADRSVFLMTMKYNHFSLPNIRVVCWHSYHISVWFHPHKNTHWRLDVICAIV